MPPQFSTPARESIIFVKGMLGICQLVFALIYAVILLRYRSLVPAMCLLIFAEWGLNRVLGDGCHISQNLVDSRSNIFCRT